MNAKTKEKKTIMNALLGGEADILVVDPIKYRQMADIKNKEFYEVEKDKECKEEKNSPWTYRCRTALLRYRHPHCS